MSVFSFDSNDMAIFGDCLFTFCINISCCFSVLIIHALILLRTGALLFFALLGLSGCFITCYDRRVRNDLAQPCRELCLCCCHPGYDSAVYIFEPSA